MTEHTIGERLHNGAKIGELERLGPEGEDAMVLGVDSPGFERLSREQRLLAYYLYRAAIPGNRIAFQQSHRCAYDIKVLLETLHLHSQGLEPRVRDAVHDHLKYVWIHHGQYHHYSHTKFTPHTLTPRLLRAACEHAIRTGARLPLRPGETPNGMLARLEPHIFDAECEPLQTEQAEGVDIVARSAVNYWDPGVTARALEPLDATQRNRLNVRFALEDGQVVPEVYRVGGVYGRELEVIVGFLARALPWTEDAEQRASIEALIDYYCTGEEETFRRHSLRWLRSSSTVDYVNGFIEVYLDPRGIIGQFEANVSFRSGGGLVDRLADHAAYFEERMPWPDSYKRRASEIGRPVANVVNVLVETGDAGPVSPAAYNLPNYNDIRRDHGSKNVILGNIESSWSRDLLERTVAEFFLPEYREAALRWWRPVIRPLEVTLHEIIGHGSGRPDESLTVDPRSRLGRVYSALEECRADLVALYHMADPKLVELGAFSAEDQPAIVETAYVTYLQGWLSRLDRVPGLEVREAHEKGHHTILSYLVAGGDGHHRFGVEVVEVEGDVFVRVDDAAAARRGIAELLNRIQTAKATGDRASAEALFDHYGTRVDPRWKDNVVARKKKLHAPQIKAFVFPHLVPVVERGTVVDAVLRHDEDLTQQQLRFSRLELVTDPTVD